MEVSTINAKGQITIPAKMRKILKLEPGSQVRLFLEADDESLVMSATGSIKDAFGILPKPKKAATIEQLNAAAERAVSAQAREL